MKTKSIKIVTGIAIVCLSFLPFISKAQFNNAAITDIASGASASAVTRTSNDVKLDGLVNLQVYVWADGGYGGIGWDDGNGNTGTNTLNTNHLALPTVTLAKSGGAMYAVVVYDNPTHGLVIEYWKWNSPNFNHTSTNNITGTGDPLNELSIDGDEIGNFVIVWDDVSTNDIQVIVGGPTNFSTPQLFCTSVYRSINTTTNCLYPSVAIWDHVNSGDSQRVYVSFVKPNGSSVYDSLFVTYFKLGDITNYCTCTYTLDQKYVAASGYEFNNTHIASPNYAAGSDDWTVVAEETDNKIIGYTRYGGNNYGPTDYTVQYTVDLSDHSNVLPVVSYDNSYTNIIVGWTTDSHCTSTNFFRKEPIAVQCDLYGTPTSAPPNKYMIVPNIRNTSTSQSQSALSISGRYDSNNKMLYTWFNSNTSYVDIWYKLVSSGASTLRKANGEDEEQLISGIYPNPSCGEFFLNLSSIENENITIEIYNAIGERIYYNISIAKGNNFSKELSLKNYSDGIYLVKVTSITNSFSQKIVLSR